MSDPMTDKQGKSWRAQVQDTAVDICDEAVVQSANLYLLVRKGLIASLGAVTLTADEMREFMERLVERGEVAESDVRTMLEELRTRKREREVQVQQQRQEAAQKASGALDESIGALLDRLNLVRKSEIQALNAQIAAIGAKVEALDARRPDASVLTDAGAPAEEAETPASDLPPDPQNG
jgi:poly(hydroxyalkanoate) granule-associated protein